MLILVTGGSSSGKSEFAERLVVSSGIAGRFYLATMIAWDQECRRRIEKHRLARRGRAFETIECPVDLGGVEIPSGSAALLECMSNLTANEMYRGDGDQRPEAVKERILSGIRSLSSRAALTVVVTNEVFGDGAAYAPETRRYQALLGELNREIADMADLAYEVVCGQAVCLKGEPGRSAAAGQAACGLWTAQGETGRTRMDGFGSGTEEGTGLHMKVVVGGAFQGKTAFALGLLGDKGADEKAADGRSDPVGAAFERRLILHLEAYVRRFVDGEEAKAWASGGGAGMEILASGGGAETEMLASGGAAETESRGDGEVSETAARGRLDAFLERLLRENPGAVVVCEEIGCGIVPMEREDRLWRDLTGHACKRLSGEAESVYRVICGLGQRLK